MTEQEIIEGNKLIAEFMNVAVPERNNPPYHKSWEWLMPVVGKIEKDGEPVEIIGNISRTHYFTHSYSPNNKYFKVNGETKIEAVYKSIVEFIKHYNEQK